MDQKQLTLLHFLVDAIVGDPARARSILDDAESSAMEPHLRTALARLRNALVHGVATKAELEKVARTFAAARNPRDVRFTGEALLWALENRQAAGLG